MAIDVEIVRKIAALAYLDLTPAEEGSLSADLGRILDYIELLRAVPTEGVPITTHPVTLPGALEDDVVRESLARDEALAAAADSDRTRGVFRVPRVV